MNERSNTRTNNRTVTAFAPGTVANLGPGFDVLGLAIAGRGDRVTATLSNRSGIHITAITGDQGRLPLDAASNTAGIAATATLKAAGVDVGVDLTVHKGMPIGSGLGSSAASAAAAAFAVNRLIGSPLRKQELVSPCVEAEAAVAGRHADNVAPAILGGLIMVRGVDPLELVRLPVPIGLQVVVVTPVFELSTRLAREALPKQVALQAMVTNAANIATFVSACYSSDLGLLAKCVQDDIVTPARAALIPGGNDVIRAAQDAGALGSSISGSGPSIFALCHSTLRAEKVRSAMIAAFKTAGLEASGIICSADCPGVREL